jgi:hypothetical protein
MPPSVDVPTGCVWALSPQRLLICLLCRLWPLHPCEEVFMYSHSPRWRVHEVGPLQDALGYRVWVCVHCT